MPRFSKYSGAGNDFVLVRAEEVGLSDPGRLARRICPRTTGVGVDGLVLIRSLSPEAVRLRFFNPDGSEFSTCGNGSRCAARYAVDRGLAEERLLLITDGGEIEARVRGEGVALAYRLDARVERSFKVPVEGRARTAWLVAIGTPHLVVMMDRLPEVPAAEFEAACRPLRHHPELGPEGANVDLVAPRGPDTALIRTFERGVEGETLACGSGAMAAALVLRETGLAGTEVALRTRSGATLWVRLGDAGDGESWDGTAEGKASDRAAEGMPILLEGPARFLFDGVFPDAGVLPDSPDAGAPSDSPGAAEPEEPEA